MADTAKQLLARFDALRNRDANVRRYLQDIAEFVRPNRSNIIREVLEGQKMTQKLFDSTADYASYKLASTIHSTLTPSTQPWLSYEMRDETLQAIKSVQDWLEDCARRTYKADRASNFNTAVHEMYLDLTDFGQGALFIEEKPPTVKGIFGGFRYKCIPVGTYHISEDYDGRVDTLFRLFKIPARVAVQQWKDAAGERINKLAQTKPDEQVEFLHAVYPRTDYDASKRTAKNMAWASCYVAVADKLKVDEGGFQEFPFCVPRWSKTSGEINGRGPSHTALPDIISLNEAKRIMLQAAPLKMQPPSVEINDAVVGDFDRSAGARIVVEPQGGRPLSETVTFLDTKTNPEMGQFELNDLRGSVKEMYYEPLLQLPDKPNMTLGEVQIRYEIVQRILGPTSGRLEAEFLNPMSERKFKIMARAGGFAPMPQELTQAVRSDTADLDIKFEGQMARAQRTVELTAQDRVVAFAMQWAAAEQKPDALDVLKRDKMIKSRAEITGMASDELNSDEEIQAIRDQRQQAQQAAAQLQAGAQIVDSAGKAAPLVTAIDKLRTRGQAQAVVGGGQAA